MTDLEKLAPFLPDVLFVAQESGEDASRIAGLLFRETDCTWSPFYTPQGSPRGTGDGGHGHGIAQVDDRYWGDWLRRNEWWVPRVAVRFIAARLKDARKLCQVYPSAPSEPADIERVVFASYNCGLGGALKGWREAQNPDLHTAHGDYSAWTFAKARALLAHIPELKTT